MLRTGQSVKPGLVVILMVGLLLAACAPGRGITPTATHAAEPAGNVPGGKSALHVELVGLLEALGPETATVGGQVLEINAGTELASGLATNQLVVAETVMGAEGLAAVAIRPAQTSQPSGLTFELTGVIESQASEAWVIGGHSVRLETGTELAGSPAVGDLVKVQGSGDGAGTLVAREIQAVGATAAANQPAGAEVEFNGVVTRIGANEWVVGANTVRVSPQTEIKAGVALGAFVKVHALPQTDGSLLAREIELTASSVNGGPPQPGGTAQPSGEQEFTGTLTAINGDVWTVAGRPVRVTTATEVKGTLQVGDVVKVHASPGSDGMLVAREVEPAAGADGNDDDNGNDDGNANEQEFTGVLSAINGDVWTVAGRQVRLTGSTEVKGTLQVGDVVKVHASPGSDGVLVAREVELAAGDDNSGDDDDNSGSGNGGDDANDDNSGSGNGSDDDNSGSGSGDDDGDANDDNSGHGGDDDDDDDNDDNSGHGGGDDDSDEDNSGSGSDD